MAEVTRKRTGQFLQELFCSLLENNRSLPAKEVLAKLAQRSKLSPYEAGSYETGGRRFEKIVRFATVDCVKAGWLVKDKGTWTITDDGAAALARWSDPEHFYKEAVKLYHAWKRSHPVTSRCLSSRTLHRIPRARARASPTRKPKNMPGTRPAHRRSARSA